MLGVLHGGALWRAAHLWANSTAMRCAPMKERLKYFTAACASATVRYPTKPNWRDWPSLRTEDADLYLRITDTSQELMGKMEASVTNQGWLQQE